MKVLPSPDNYVEKSNYRTQQHEKDKLLLCSQILLPAPFQSLPFSPPEDGLSVQLLEAMSLGRLLRRASSKASDLLTFNPGAGGTSARSGLDGEIIFSKNNVCVHPAEPVPGLPEHHPGSA